ncbi:hypothetical protein M758_3G265600 [Ceratodon purpureus]|nr:hypothetical protein M758_3G265600 [Ceratodon purpureus]
MLQSKPLLSYTPHVLVHYARDVRDDAVAETMALALSGRSAVSTLYLATAMIVCRSCRHLVLHVIVDRYQLWIHASHEFHSGGLEVFTLDVYACTPRTLGRLSGTHLCFEAVHGFGQKP